MFIVQEELQVQTIHVNWNLIEAVHFWKDWIEDSPENPRVIPNVPKDQLSKFLRRVSELAPGDSALPELSQSPDTGWSGLSLSYQSDHERVGPMVIIMCHIHNNIYRTRRSRASSVSPTSSVSSSPKSASPTFDEHVQYYPARKPYRSDSVLFKPFYLQRVHFRMASSFELSSDQPALYYQRARKLTGT